MVKDPNLVQELQNDLTKALKKGDKDKISILRLLLSDINYQKIAQKGKLSDKDILSLIQKQVKKHQESISFYKKAQRKDLLEKEQKELEILKTYLPKQLSPQEIEKIIAEKISAIKDPQPSDFGKIMKQVMLELKGKADGNLVSQLVREKLSF